jgi:hypothetical protein
MKNFKLVIEAHARNEYGGGPNFAVIEVSQAFVAYSTLKQPPVLVQTRHSF